MKALAIYILNVLALGSFLAVLGMGVMFIGLMTDRPEPRYLPAVAEEGMLQCGVNQESCL